MESVLKAIEDYPSSHITVKFLVSLDRRHSLQDNCDSVKLAIKFIDKGVVGVDVCGDPSKGSWDMIHPALLLAKQAGLKVTVHLAEIPGSEAESVQMLESRLVDRVGTYSSYFNRLHGRSCNVS